MSPDETRSIVAALLSTLSYVFDFVYHYIRDTHSGLRFIPLFSLYISSTVAFAVAHFFTEKEVASYFLIALKIDTLACISFLLVRPLPFRIIDLLWLFVFLVVVYFSSSFHLGNTSLGRFTCHPASNNFARPHPLHHRLHLHWNSRCRFSSIYIRLVFSCSTLNGYHRFWLLSMADGKRSSYPWYGNCQQFCVGCWNCLHWPGYTHSYRSISSVFFCVRCCVAL